MVACGTHVSRGWGGMGGVQSLQEAPGCGATIQTEVGREGGRQQGGQGRGMIRGMGGGRHRSRSRSRSPREAEGRGRGGEVVRRRGRREVERERGRPVESAEEVESPGRTPEVAGYRGGEE